MGFQIKIYDFFTKGEVPVFRIGRHVKRSENLNRQGLNLINRIKGSGARGLLDEQLWLHHILLQPSQDK
ncbi:hypothetical protein [Bacillus sp. OV322]|uniref:hypothetical protein n=1 Tax=Bacillus sp. OV322 TaxID=1882764 RepID=UPI000B81C7D6|nr:hypothetical protein [Bacillus sp. OV322]